MNEYKWAIRKIRPGGRVKIGGHWWEPDIRFKKYDGRLDGMVFVFGRYKDYASSPDGYLNLLDMWGTKEMWYASKNMETEEWYNKAWNENPAAVVEEDGHKYLPWSWWKQKGTQNETPES